MRCAGSHPELRLGIDPREHGKHRGAGAWSVGDKSPGYAGCCLQRPTELVGAQRGKVRSEHGDRGVGVCQPHLLDRVPNRWIEPGLGAFWHR